jgi:hypothetical protein
MSAESRRPPMPMVLNEGVHHIVGRMRVVQALLGVGLASVLLVSVIGIFVRLGRAGSFGAVLLTGGVAIASLVLALAAQGAAEARAKRAGGLNAALRAYQLGCGIGGGLNVLAGCVTAASVFASGVGNGLWLPMCLVVALNAVAVALSMPRVSRFRRLFYSPSLPYARL